MCFQICYFSKLSTNKKKKVQCRAYSVIIGFQLQFCVTWHAFINLLNLAFRNKKLVIACFFPMVENIWENVFGHLFNTE